MLIYQVRGTQCKCVKDNSRNSRKMASRYHQNIYNNCSLTVSVSYRDTKRQGRYIFFYFSKHTHITLTTQHNTDIFEIKSSIFHVHVS